MEKDFLRSNLISPPPSYFAVTLYFSVLLLFDILRFLRQFGGLKS